MGSLRAVIINEFDLAGLGLIVERVDGWLDGLSVTERSTKLPGRVGSVKLTPEAESAERIITVTGVIEKTSVSLVRTAIDELKRRLSAGEMEVRFVDQEDRYVIARQSSLGLIATPPQFLQPASRVTFRLLCNNPLIYSREPSAVGFSTVKQPIPLGTAVSSGVIILKGAATNPKVTYRDFTGKIVKEMGYTVTLGVDDRIEINTDTDVMDLYVAGVKSSAADEWDGIEIISFDPHDSDAVGSWPTLEVNAGTGEAHYKKAWQ